ncbi:MAG: twin-arginine translocase TatA/TatE family subunit [Acidobacteriota bacterium]|nr:twin-arginine translocase TatA/TatE family subunit [Acidobacteriota bacterium]
MFEGLMQPMHLLVILFIALLVFGPSKLSDLGKGLGQGIKNFKDAVNDKGNQQQAAAAPAPAPAPAPVVEPVKKDNAPTA